MAKPLDPKEQHIQDALKKYPLDPATQRDIERKAGLPTSAPADNATAIHELEAYLAVLRSNKEDLLLRIEYHMTGRGSAWDRLHTLLNDLNRQIREAEERLAHHRNLRDKQN